MSAQNPYKAAGIIAVIYFALLLLVLGSLGLCFIVLSSVDRNSDGLVLGGLALIAVPLLGIIASAIIIARGANTFSIVVYTFFTLLFACAAIGVAIALIVDMPRNGPEEGITIILVCLLHTGLFSWLTYSLWKHRRKRPNIIAEVFDDKK